MVARTSLNVTLYVHCLSSSIFNEHGQVSYRTLQSDLAFFLDLSFRFSERHTEMIGMPASVCKITELAFSRETGCRHWFVVVETY